MELSPCISIVIPTYNEDENLKKILPYLKEILEQCHLEFEIIVVDSPESSDNSRATCSSFDIKYHVAKQGGRARQLCEGYTQSSHDILYFLHADTIPPENFPSEITCSLEEGFEAGCFAYKFNSSSWLLKVNAWFTRFKTKFTGGGDQGLFITRSLYENIGGYDPSVVIMEDFDLYDRLKRQGVPFKIVKNPAIVSARKYEKNGYLKVQLVNLYLLTNFRRGVNRQKLLDKSRAWLNY